MKMIVKFLKEKWKIWLNKGKFLKNDYERISLENVELNNLFFENVEI